MRVEQGRCLPVEDAQRAAAAAIRARRRRGLRVCGRRARHGEELRRHRRRQPQHRHAADKAAPRQVAALHAADQAAEQVFRGHRRLSLDISLSRRGAEITPPTPCLYVIIRRGAPLQPRPLPNSWSTTLAQ